MEAHPDNVTTRFLEETAVDGAAGLILLTAMSQNGTCEQRSLVPDLMNEEMFNLAAERAVDKGYLIPVLGSDRLSVGRVPKETMLWFADWLSDEGGCGCLNSMATAHYSGLVVHLLQVSSPLMEWDIIDMLGIPHELGQASIMKAHEHPNINPEQVDEDEYELYGRQSAWLEFQYFRKDFTEVYE